MSSDCHPSPSPTTRPEYDAPRRPRSKLRPSARRSPREPPQQRARPPCSSGLGATTTTTATLFPSSLSSRQTSSPTPTPTTILSLVPLPARSRRLLSVVPVARRSLRPAGRPPPQPRQPQPQQQPPLRSSPARHRAMSSIRSLSPANEKLDGQRPPGPLAEIWGHRGVRLSYDSLVRAAARARGALSLRPTSPGRERGSAVSRPTASTRFHRPFD
jgi:hypothetical protein